SKGSALLLVGYGARDAPSWFVLRARRRFDRRRHRRMLGRARSFRDRNERASSLVSDAATLLVVTKGAQRARRAVAAAGSRRARRRGFDRAARSRRRARRERKRLPRGHDRRRERPRRAAAGLLGGALPPHEAT